MPQRLFCSNSSNLSTKVMSERRLRSRKVIITNENSRKVNVNRKVSTRKGKTRMEAKSTSRQESVMSKINEDSSINETKKVDNKREKKTQRKGKGSKVDDNKNNNKNKKSTKKKQTADSSPLRQMSLKESFMHQSLKRLRPRRNEKNYCEDSKLMQQYLPQQQQKSVVLLDKLDLTDGKKVPIYKKTMKVSEPSSENNNDVYDFQYDTNDTREKPVKRNKKKRNVNRMKKVVKKTVRKKVIAVSKPIDDEIDKSNSRTDCAKIVRSNLVTEHTAKTLVTSIEKNTLEKIEIPRIEVQEVEETTSFDRTAPIEQTEKRDAGNAQLSPNAQKPKIISVENADNIKVIKSFDKFDDSQPFRPTNILNNDSIIQHKNSLTCSLLVKSLSPILKTQDTFDPGSPWRPPTLSMFSRAKHFIQSTPNVTKTDIIRKRHIVEMKSNLQNNNGATNTSDTISANSTIQSASDKANGKKNSNSSRKFGTEITNIEHLNLTAQVSNAEMRNEKPATEITEVEIKPVSNIELDAVASTSPSYSSFDDVNDKENLIPNYQTPKKPTKKIGKKRVLNASPSKAFKVKNNAENVDPQPGPSGMKRQEKYNEQRILHQCNLNNFLNLMDMPEATRISTKSGIFTDAHSTPINSRAIEKVNKYTMELENAFGFCEKESEFDVPTTEDELATNQRTTKIRAMCSSKSTQPVTARLSLKELRNHLQKKTDKLKTNKNTEANKIDKETTEANNNGKTDQKTTEANRSVMDIMNFSDTFDVLSNSERLSNWEENMPLFMDLEPSRFSKPPAHSYKRKRAMTFNFSEDSEEEEKECEDRVYTKKRKRTKLEIENRKRLDAWVKTINGTFQEIDEYDLLIE